MNYCEIKSTPRAQTLYKMSGLSEFSAMSSIKGFFNRNNRFPELDEIPNANSEKELDKKLKINKIKNSKFTTVDTLEELTKGKSVEETNVILNDEHTDLEIHLNQIGDAVLVETLHRPTEYNVSDNISSKNSQNTIEFDGTRESNSVILRKALDKLRRYYGIQMIPITKDELMSDQFKGLPVSEASAFILNGNIYINTDKASIDSPIHEQLHLFLGSIRFKNPTLYYQLVQSTEQLPNFNVLASKFSGRTMSDIQEEIFVEELAKYLVGSASMFDNIDQSIINQLMYNIKRDIDSIVFGEKSVKSLTNVFGKSLLQLAEELNSDNFNIDTLGTLDSATIHRMLANTKEELMQKNELIQDCT